MSKPPHDSQAPASASEDLVERLNAAANDVVLLRAIIESNDIGSVTAAFAALLTGDSASALNGSALRKKVSLLDNLLKHLSVDNLQCWI